MNLRDPLGLLALLALPAALAIVFLARRRRPRYAVRFTNLDVLASVVAETRSLRRWLPLAFALAALASLSLALARPQVTTATPVTQTTVVLVFDTSRSMQANDVKPTRIGAAQTAALDFLARLPRRIRVGVVSFSTDAQVVAYPTTNRPLVTGAIHGLQLGFRTAIGDGLSRALDLVVDATRDKETGRLHVPRPNPRRPLGVVLLLSDGRNNSGLLQPLQVARRARSLGIPVNTVALGTNHGSLTFDPQGQFFGGATLAPDPVTLSQIAEVTGGTYFRAVNEKRLTTIYRHLGGTVGRERRRHELTSAFVGGGAALLACSAICSLLWRPRLP
jgi:Ca-activated chloride channel family protein